jgi:PIN domain nuclease of toxin-antitoxin system
MILLDTHVVVWLVGDPKRLSPRAHDAILHARASGESIAFSPVSIFEIAYAAYRKRLPLTVATSEFIGQVEEKLKLVPLTSEIARRAAELPDHFHGDPMDRIIAATAIVENCALITHDDRIRRAKVCNVVW